MKVLLFTDSPQFDEADGDVSTFVPVSAATLRTSLDTMSSRGNEPVSYHNPATLLVSVHH